MLIFEQSQPGRSAAAQLPAACDVPDDLPQALRRDTPVGLPEVSELQVVRHYTRLSRKNFSIDTSSTLSKLFLFVTEGARSSKMSPVIR